MRVKKFELFENMNVNNSALNVIKKKGFEVGVIFAEFDNEYDDGLQTDKIVSDWVAKNGVVEFVAEDPLSLLGLVAIWLERGFAWCSDSDEDLYDYVRDIAYCDD